MRKTKIICTIGPASESEEKLRELIEAGMDVARFNFSHGTYEEHKAKFKRLVRLRHEMGRPVATLMDTKGPEIRLRDFEGGKAVLERGKGFTLTTEEVMGTAERAAISYKGLVNDVSNGSCILIDDGLIELRVDNVTETEIHCTVVNGGPISNHKGVNVPGAELSMPFISDQDRQDIEFGCKLGYEYIAASFVRTAEDVRDIRKILDKFGSRMKIIAKIESTQGVNNIDEILDEADGVMVARGDLGVEVRRHCHPDAGFHDAQSPPDPRRGDRRRQRDLRRDDGDHALRRDSQRLLSRRSRHNHGQDRRGCRK